MLPLLLIPPALGWVLARHWLRQNEWPGLISVTLSAGLVFTLIGVNFFYRHTSLEQAVCYTLALEIIALVFLWLNKPRTVSKYQPLSCWLHWTLIALAALVGLYCNAQQIANTDDDYWIHAPLQGLMRQGNFPPFNPFFVDIPMNGHYGRNLSIVIFSYLSGADVFLSQHLLTSGLQVLTLWLFFCAFLASANNRVTALVGTVFVFFGINAGGRGGLIDTMQNNNALVHLYLAFLCWLTVETWKHGRKMTAVIGGLTLGSYAIVYETHFGLVFLTILGVTPLLWTRKLIESKQATAAVVVLLLSLPLAFTQGGPLTDLLNRRVEARGHTQAEILSKGMQNQAQMVKFTFPKKELFQILLETGEYQRTANIYLLDTPLKMFHRPSTERGYAYIWSWDVLKIHFLPLLLLPFSAFVLWRKGSFAGLFMGAFGTIAFLVPALVHFGPIYESEYFRWQFAASLGFAGALGLALASLVEQSHQRSPWRLKRGTLVINPVGKRYLLLILLTLVNSWASLHFVGRRLQDSLGTDLKKWLIFPSTRQWLAQHQVLDFDHLDYEAASWLRTRVKPGDALLVNFAAENNFSILYESTLTGLTGARCVGHALPLEDEKIGTTPFRRNPAAHLFWQDQRLEALKQLQVDWIFYKGDSEEPAPDFPASQLVHSFKENRKIRHLYKVDQSRLPKFFDATSGTPALHSSIEELATSMRGGQAYEGHLAGPTLRPTSVLRGTLELSTKRKSDGLISSPSENLKINLDSEINHGRKYLGSVPFVAPYDEGEYELLARYHPAPNSQNLTIEPFLFRSEFQKLLPGISVRNFQISQSPDALRPRQLLYPVVALDLPQALPPSQTLLACWAFYSEERQEFDLLPGINLKTIELSEELTDLPFITPERSGDYRLALYLSAGQGHLTRIPVTQVTVKERAR